LLKNENNTIVINFIFEISENRLEKQRKTTRFFNRKKI